MGVHEGSWAPGTPCWVDISVPDLARSQAFYAAVLGWEFTEGTEEFGGYTTALVNGRGAAGMAPPMNGQGGAPTFWTVYLATADSAATEAAITAAGGQVIAPTMTLGDLGAMGIYADPTGAVFGTWQSGSHTGYDVANEPGAVAWCEAAVGDFDAGKSFYTDVFGYSYLDMSGPGAAYAMFSVPEGDRPAGGLSGPSPDRPPSWSVTFETDGVDAAVARAQANGGAVLREPFDFQYGRLALVAGPDGEPFGLMTSVVMSG